MNVTELSNRFDVLYNNITSSQAPGLDEYEKSVFLNKAQLEVLKNHLNQKGNKYGEGYDSSSKRQIEFSSLTVEGSYCPALYDVVTKPNGSFCKTAYRFPISSYIKRVDGQGDEVVDDAGHIVYDEIPELGNHFHILNEYVETLQKSDAVGFTAMTTTYLERSFLAYDFNNSGSVNISDLTAAVNAGISEESQFYAGIKEVIMSGKEASGVFTKNYTVSEAIDEEHLTTQHVTVVPINYVEFDTLMSRPYKYPPKQQAWRLFIDGHAEIIVTPDVFPIKYHVRYVRFPKEVNLVTGIGCELPEVLHDEVLQRAVELAKAAYVSDANQQQIIQTLGERSE
jgi:hypothetical protein